jgi:5-methylcytosine-specific restriction endonuclease McrA
MQLLQNPTLVLNRAWVPIRTTPVRQALCLLFKGSALVVEPETYRTYSFQTWADLRAAEHEPRIATVRLAIRVPEVIVLTRYDRTPDREVVFSRRNIFKRDGYTCQYCGARPGTKELTIDHVLPRARGGKSEWTNCVLACVECNARKANRTPREARMNLRRVPVKPAWKPIFTMKVGTLPTAWKDFLSEAYWNVPLEE